MFKDETKRKVLLEMYGSINSRVVNDFLGNVIIASYDNLKRGIITISLMDTTTFSKKECTVLKELKNLKELDLKEYSCKAKIPYELYVHLKERGVKIILNPEVTYHKLIEYTIKMEESKKLREEEKRLLTALKKVRLALRNSAESLNKGEKSDEFHNKVQA